MTALAGPCATVGPCTATAGTASAQHRTAPLRPDCLGRGRVQPHLSSLQARVPARRVGRLRRGTGTVTSAGPQPLFEAAFGLPGGALVTLLRAATAGVGIFALLQWSTFRGMRKQVQDVQEEEKGKSANRAERLKRLQPKTPPYSD